MNTLGAPDPYFVDALVNAVVGCVATVLASAVAVYAVLLLEEWHVLRHRPAAGGDHDRRVPLAGRW